MPQTWTVTQEKCRFQGRKWTKEGTRSWLSRRAEPRVGRTATLRKYKEQLAARKMGSFQNSGHR